MIDLQNYEAYFLDYYEGNLSSEEREQLYMFLSNNESLRASFESFENCLLPDKLVLYNEEISPLTKVALKKCPKIHHANEAEFFIAELEGDLSEKETQELQSYLAASKDRVHRYEMMQKTKLVPETIVFEQKGRLKKNRKIASLWFNYAAASILLFMLLFPWKIDVEQVDVSVIGESSKEIVDLFKQTKNSKFERDAVNETIEEEANVELFAAQKKDSEVLSKQQSISKDDKETLKDKRLGGLQENMNQILSKGIDKITNGPEFCSPVFANEMLKSTIEIGAESEFERSFLRNTTDYLFARWVKQEMDGVRGKGQELTKDINQLMASIVKKKKMDNDVRWALHIGNRVTLKRRK